MSMAETQPFLADQVNDAIPASPPLGSKFQKKSFQTSPLKFGIALLYTVFVSLLSIQVYHMSQKQGRIITGGLDIDSIAQTTKLFIPSSASNYTGKPNDQNSAAWKKLLELQMIRLSSSEFSKSGISTIQLQESPGFMATTTLWHELHCVWYLRATIYKDVYHPSMTEKEAEQRETHADHCLHILQQSVMCSGDTTLMGLYWQKEESHPLTRRSSSLHRCVDWETLETTFRHRVVSSDEALNLKNPLHSSGKDD